MMMGGLGLFLEPGGRPRGRRGISIVAPSLAAAVGGSLVVVVVVWVSVCSSCSWEVWKRWRFR